MARIASIGMGMMGSGIAERLLSLGHDVVGYDINPDTRASLAARGVSMADILPDALHGRDIVLSCLPHPDAVRGAWLGPDGIVAHAQDGALCVELSTIDPTTMKEVGSAAEGRGLDAVDCPVSGSPKEATIGKLVLIAGGSQGAMARAEPLLLQLGETWRYTGGVGSAKVIKIVNNMMTMGNILVAAEAFAVGTAAGVDPELLYDVLSVSGGRSHHFTKRFPNAIKGDWQPGFKIELGVKDLTLAIDFGHAVGQPTPAAELARGLTERAVAQGYSGQDIVALLHMYQHWYESREQAVGETTMVTTA